MNTIFIVISIALIFVNLTTSKPIEQIELKLKPLETESQYSNQMRSIVKRLTAGEKSSSDTGFAGVITTEETKNRKKKRLCEEWIKIPITNQMKCTKFKFTGPITFPDSPILRSLEMDHPYKEHVVNRHEIKDLSIEN